MARSRFPTHGRSQSQRRLTTWFQFQPVATVDAAVGGTLVGSLNAAALALRPFTIVRTRFLVGILSDQAAVSESQVGAFGMAVVSDQAAAIGVTAIPMPITDMSSDLWFVHQLMYSDFQIDSSVGFQSDAMHQYVIDSKAMRKVEVGEDIVLVTERSGTGDGILTIVGGRALVKVN